MEKIIIPEEVFMKQNFEWRVLFGKNRRAGIRVSILLALALVLGTLPLDVSGGGY